MSVTDDRLVRGFFLVQVISVVFLQKVALPGGIELCLPVLLGSLAVMVAAGRVALNPLRFLLMALFLTAAGVSQVLSGVSFSVLSVLMLVAIYVPMGLVIPVKRETFLRCIAAFQWVMMAILVITLAQHVIQLVASWRLWPNLDEILPRAFQYQGYNYLQPLKYGAKYYKPNAIFFLETSFLSQFAALAIILEVIFFRRLVQLVCFLALLLLTFAGTGLLVLAVTAPFLIFKAGARAIIAAAFGAIALAGVVVGSGYIDQVGERVTEVQHPGTSGYYRFTAPLMRLTESAADPSTLFTGIGAGNTADFGNASIPDLALPPVKLVMEYGFVPMFLFFAYLLVAMMHGSPSHRMNVGFLAYFLLGGGGLLVPVYGLMPLLFCTLLRIRPDDEDGASGSPWTLAPPSGRMAPSPIHTGPFRLRLSTDARRGPAFGAPKPQPMPEPRPAEQPPAPAEPVAARAEAPFVAPLLALRPPHTRKRDRALVGMVASSVILTAFGAAFAYLYGGQALESLRQQRLVAPPASEVAPYASQRAEVTTAPTVPAAAPVAGAPGAPAPAAPLPRPATPRVELRPTADAEHPAPPLPAPPPANSAPVPPTSGQAPGAARSSTPAAPPIAAVGPVVQIGAFPSAAMADKAWSDVAAAFGPDMAGKGRRTEPAPGTVLLRSQITGFPSRKAASDFCVKLKAAGRSCLVK